TGAYTLSAIAAGFDPPNPAVQAVTPPAGGNALRNLQLTPLASISGRLIGVAGPSFALLGGVEVTATASGGGASGTFTAVTRGDGRFTITGTIDDRGLLAGTYTLTASANGYKALSIAKTVTAGQAFNAG